MGISSFFSSLVKGLTWTQVAGLAIEYAPELYRKAMERFQAGKTGEELAEEAELHERLARVEKLLLEQEELIREQVVKNELLEYRRQALESQLLLFQIIAGVLTLGCIILLAVLFK